MRGRRKNGVLCVGTLKSRPVNGENRFSGPRRRPRSGRTSISTRLMTGGRGPARKCAGGGSYGMAPLRALAQTGNETGPVTAGRVGLQRSCPRPHPVRAPETDQMQSPGVQGDAMAEKFSLTARYIVPADCPLSYGHLGSAEARRVPIDPVPGKLCTRPRCQSWALPCPNRPACS